ncbi:Predicted membrane protein [Bordetella ansorpii]|uniref:Predicted membrane protein n=1 Tax=Bordetella ansorpii TaxID=288768 RepID=A0A157RM04_9BORD|nr:TadG family pilus assembly protein [Bordetella ansorpii]SAI58449.1 Predicted membrane protein [Bordetella ansorpii]
MLHTRFPRLPRRQRGSILIPAAMAILLGMVLLWGVQLGYAFYLKRELQKTADMAALTAAQVLAGGGATECAAAVTAAQSAITANMRDLGTPQVACVRWDGKNTALAPRYIRSADIGAGERYNAVSINLSTTAPSLFPFTEGVTLYAEAVGARPADPVAAFSVGTRLAKAKDGAVLTNLLKGVGLNIADTALVGYDAGLANVKITPAGLLNQLGIDVPANISVADLNQLLAAKTAPLGGLIDAVVNLGGRSELLAANVGLLHAVEAAVNAKNLQVQLGSNVDGRASSLFAKIVAPDAQSALNVEVSALDILGTAIGVGTGGHAIEVGGSGIDFLGISVKPQIRVIEPPSIAIGGVGATAYTAQVRLYLPISVRTPQLLSGLLDLDVSLPIVVDLVNGKGTITSMCQARDASSRELATIAVQSSIAKVCIGGAPAGAAAGWPFSTSASCDQNLEKQQLLSLRLLGTSLASLNTKLTVDALPADGSATLYAGQPAQTVPANGNQLMLGTTLKKATDALLTALLGQTAATGTGPGFSTPDQQAQLRKDLANKVFDDAKLANGCNVAATGQAGYQCRQALWQSALTTIQNGSSGLQGLLGTTLNNSVNLLSDVLTLNVVGVLNSTGNLVGGLLNSVGDVLRNVLGGIIPTNTCASWSLLGGYQGNETGCKTEIANSLKNTGPVGAGQPSNAVIALLGLVLGILQQPLDNLGAGLAQTVNNVVGLELGQTDVNLLSLDCNGKGVQLVY